MNVLISWSGRTSYQVAQVLRKWLPAAVPSATVLFSADIPSGEDWLHELHRQAEAADFSLLCVTRENINSPWIWFEAGTMWKSGECTVVPISFDLLPSERNGPIRMFQVSTFERDDMWQLIYALNVASGNQMPLEKMERIFDSLYPVLKEGLNQVHQEGTSRHTQDKNPNENLETQRKEDVENLKQQIVTVNRKLDTILSSLSRLPQAGKTL